MTRERVIWIAGFILASALIVLTRFQSRDPDSTLHASIAARLAAEPMQRWVAPEWWGLWPEAHLTGLYVEHPAGIFLLPALLQRVGIPAVQAAYVVGIGASLLAVLLIGSLVARVATPTDARAAMTLVQVIPLAFIFRIRANHEFPMLVCLLLALVALERVRQSWTWVLAIALSFTAALCIKGVFAGFVLLGTGLWILVNPTRRAGMTRQVIACATAVALTTVVALVYDRWYEIATGHPFWQAYWHRQISPLVPGPSTESVGIARHLIFYAPFLLWHPAPWNFSLLSSRLRGTDATRLVMFAALFAAASLVLLSFSSRVAERYLFSANYLVGGVGAVVAYRSWPVVRRALDRLDARVPALPAIAWTTLIVLRIAVGSWLPRLQVR